MDLAEIRREIDVLDEQIVGLIARRQALVSAAGALKRNEEAVRAPDRVEQVIARVRERAEAAGADSAVVEATYRAMIGAFIDLEMGEMRRAGGA